MYITRTLEKTIHKVSSFFPVLLVTGPRQVGKTTMLQACAGTDRNYVSLDNLENRNLAQTDPALFLQHFKAPLLIDEIQYAPQLFPYIKELADRHKQAGMFWLTGSWQFQLMKNVSESLAGRVGILELGGLSQAESDGQPERQPFLPEPDAIALRAASAPRTDVATVFHRIWKGSYPKMHDADDSMWSVFYESYVKTYIERDIRDLRAVSNELTFLKFMKILASRTGQLLNYSDIAGDLDVSAPTVKSWVSLLQASRLIFMLQPYHSSN
ncbi:MAG: AAA family ATPase, partial [Desulfovibrionaceae bacterium]|nr:AAA family ATPase [Desulfovibrionaceae bacterium]